MFAVLASLMLSAAVHGAAVVSGELKQWHAVTLTRWARSMRNHPSVVMYSSSNEMFLVKYTNEETLVLGKAIRSADPTRAIVHDGMKDVGDDAVSYHYPRQGSHAWNGEPWNWEAGLYEAWKSFFRTDKPATR
jgi:beta-galactosidase/beta-glucuronidase